MTPKVIARTVLYSIWALSNIFLVATKGFNAETWKSLDWFEILTLALVMNSNLLLVVIAYLDNSVPGPTGATGAPGKDYEKTSANL